MLEPLLTKLCQRRIVLASSSPRRRLLLHSSGLRDFEIISSDFEETVDKTKVLDPSSYVERMARGKAKDVWRRQVQTSLPDLVVGADTVVFLDGRIFEKPKSTEDAVSMLSTLSGRTHVVYTGVCMLVKDPSGADDFVETVFNETTEVTMGDLPSSVIKAYVATGEPMDKAGAYGIQGTACSSLIDTVNGSFDNVVGFPTHTFCRKMYEIFGRPE